MSPPVRRGICLACRTLLDEGRPCPGGRGHKVVSLGQRVERARLVEEVWGPDSRARALRQAAKAGAGGGSLGLLDACTGCDVTPEVSAEGMIITLVVAAAALLGIVLWLIVKHTIALVRKLLDRPKPHGALLAPARPRGARVGTGVVLPGRAVPLPWRHGSASAYAWELYAKRVFGGAAMLRVAESAGFEVRLDDGRIVSVPAGPLLLSGRMRGEDFDEGRVDRYLNVVDPTRPTIERGAPSLDVFPHDHARALVVNPGDRVVVIGAVTRSADAGAEGAGAGGGVGGGGYRESAGVLVPVGIPMLRVLRADGTPGADGDDGDDLAAEASGDDDGDPRVRVHTPADSDDAVDSDSAEPERHRGSRE